MREYSELFKSNGNDIVGNLSFNNMVSVNGGRYKIENLFKYLKKNEFDVSGYWIREKTKIQNIHYHFVLKLENDRDKNMLKNMIFKYWKWNGSVMVKDYDDEIALNYEAKSDCISTERDEIKITDQFDKVLWHENKKKKN